MTRKSWKKDCQVILIATLVTILFWIYWDSVNGEIPQFSSIKLITNSWEVLSLITLPFGISGWWSVLFVPLWLFVAALLIRFKEAQKMIIKMIASLILGSLAGFTMSQFGLWILATFALIITLVIGGFIVAGPGLKKGLPLILSMLLGMGSSTIFTLLPVNCSITAPFFIMIIGAVILFLRNRETEID
ncbi:hypothetical protein KKF32_02840 [Patescibacteria group bacterium]|nr:hypothetical protein [Patescibacteria group bacterium]